MKNTVPVRVVIVRQANNNYNMTDFFSSDDEGEARIAATTANLDNDSEKTEELKTIFDDEYVEKFTDEDGKARWKCKWCGTTFAGWNATKALAHVYKGSAKADIKSCRGRIDDKSHQMYASLYQRQKKRRDSSRERVSALSNSIASHNKRVSLAYDEKNTSKRTKTSNVVEIDESSPSTDTRTARTTSLSTMTSSMHENTTNKKKNSSSFTQTLLHDGPNPNAESKLTMAIAC